MRPSGTGNRSGDSRRGDSIGCGLGGGPEDIASVRFSSRSASASSAGKSGDIVRNAIDLARALGIPRPRVAILSAVETVTSKLRSTLDAAALCKMAERGQIEGGILDGPLAFDNAVSLAAARTKGLTSAVAGQADILVAPDLESGNILAKQLEYFAGATAGGVVLGARVPVILSSRSDSLESRVFSCAVAVLSAHAHARRMAEG